MTAANRDKTTTTVVIVGGAGTFGSSTALHLLRAGYTPANITVLDVYPIPSAQSAGNDLNKILGPRYRSPVDTKLTAEATKFWMEDELFKPYFHNVGRLDCAHTPESIAALRRGYNTALQLAESEGSEAPVEWLDNEDEILARNPTLDRAQIKGWKAVLFRNSGWVAAAKAINSIGEVLAAKGVRFGFGKAGSFKRPLLDSDGSTCIGVEAEDGTRYYADKVVVASGAWTPTLIDLEDQCVSKAWVYAHIQLTPEEAAAFKDRPVVYNEDIGFYFEPNEHGIIKVCDQSPGFTHYQLHRPYGSTHPKQISVPRSHSKHPTDTIPYESEVQIRKAIAAFLPRFKDKKVFNQALCWCTDTADRNPLICEHPRWKNLIIASGDSGACFKLLPNIGIHIVELLEDRLPADLRETWKWRPGGNALKSTRAGEAKDLADAPGWQHDGPVSFPTPKRAITNISGGRNVEELVVAFKSHL